MSYTSSLTTRASLRDAIANKLVSFGKPIYKILRYRRKAWEVQQGSLKDYPLNSLGHELYSFLKRNEFQLMPRAEFHDVFHVLFNYGISMREETAIQFVVLGNGKWSLPNVISSSVAIVFYPEYWGDYKKAYLYGKKAAHFYHLDFENLLNQDLVELRKSLKLNR